MAKKKPGPPPKPLKTKLHPNEKAQVKGAFQKAVTRMRNTLHLPHKKDKFTVGPHTTTGKAVQKAVLHSYLFAASPIGFQRMPKPFSNYPYSKKHGDPALRNTLPVPNPAGAKLLEYPVTKHAQGWVGSGSVGSTRILTSNDGKHDTFHAVIGHDGSRGGSKNDHYLASHTPHSEPAPSPGKPGLTEALHDHAALSEALKDPKT